jgi:predicted transcriptional regulator
MKTAISIPDAVFTRAERLKRRLGKSRSQLYAEAIAEYVRRHDTAEVTESWNRVCDEPEAGVDPDLHAAALRVLEDTEW